LHCADCHRIHRHEAGVVFSPARPALRYQGARQSQVATTFVTDRALSVSYVGAGACLRCHDAGVATDPFVQCLPQGASVDDETPTLCFDEHRGVLSEQGDQRTAAWEAARSLALPSARLARATVASGLVAPLLALLGVCTGLRAFTTIRAFRGRGGGAGSGSSRSSAHSTPSLQPAKVRMLPQVNTATCIGCNSCVDVCPYDVLELRDYVAVVARADACCGLSLCEQRCPNGSLVITEGEPIEDRPRIGEDLQSLDTPGVFLAGDLTGLPLIRNAINQGAFAIDNIAASLSNKPAAGPHMDVVIVGAGPAGISAALQAKRLGLSYLVLEQGSVAESIRSFPRGKLVFDQPLGLPLVGDLWLRESTKEELLGKWLRIVHREQLRINEGLRLCALERTAGGDFVLRARDASDREVQLECRRLLLSFGRRGSPRKLAIPLPEELQSHVHYSLADARSFAGRRVLVVGLGDVAMETAVALAHQPNTEVAISYRGADFSRGAARNQQAVRRLVERGRIALHLGTEVTALQAGEVTLAAADGLRKVPADAVFVMIGSIAPWSFLEQLGVRRALGQRPHTMHLPPTAV
jgi:thioredoxin reductase